MSQINDKKRISDANRQKRTLRILSRRLYAPKNIEDKEITFLMYFCWSRLLQKKK